MTSSNEDSPKLKCQLLKDAPKFGEGEDFTKDEDYFNHESYADTLLNTITSNEPPLSIGLFGSWGVGKSTIINILFRKLNAITDGRYVPVVFNAWKYQGDEFRRQFLLSVAEKIYKKDIDRKNKVGYLQRLNYTSILKETTEDLATALKDAIASLFSRGFKDSRISTKSQLTIDRGDFGLLMFSFLVLLSFIVLLYLGSKFDTPAFVIGPILALLTSIFAVIISKIRRLIVIKGEKTFHPQLIFPEQFEGEFGQMVNEALDDRKLVVAIDDVDRCDPDFIKRVFVSIKTFLGNDKCFFVVACDDKSVVNAFKNTNERFGYEHLRKYFNVTLRVLPLVNADLVDLANNISCDLDIPEIDTVIQLVLLADVRDARKVKHFLNTFYLKYALAKDREKHRYFPEQIDKNIPSFAKLFIIEQEFPYIFEQMTKNPHLVHYLESAKVVDVQKLFSTQNPGNEKVENTEWEAELKSFENFWKNTKAITIDNPELLLAMKVSKPEASLPVSSELINAIVQDDAPKSDKILDGIKTDDDKLHLTDLLIDKINSTRELFLTRILKFSLELYSRESFLPESQKPKLGRIICDNLVNKEKSENLVGYNVDSIFKVCYETAAHWLNEISEKFKKALTSAKEPVMSWSDILNNLYTYNKIDKKFIQKINKNFEERLSAPSEKINEELILKILEKIKPIEEKKKIGLQIPSQDILTKIAESIKPMAVKEVLNLNYLKRKVLFDRWNENLSNPFCKRISEIGVKYQTQSDYSEAKKFVTSSIIDVPSWIPKEYASQLANSMTQFYHSSNVTEGKKDAMKAALKVWHTVPDPDVKNSTKTVFLDTSKSYSDSLTREMWKFLSGYEKIEEFKILKKEFINKQWQFVTQQVDSPDDSLKQRLDFCHEQNSYLSKDTIFNFLVSNIEVTNEQAFEFWTRVIIEYYEKLNKDFALQIANKCISDIANKRTPQGKKLQFRLFSSMLSKIVQKDKPQLLDEYFTLCQDDEDATRTAACEVMPEVKEHIEENDFRIRLQNLIRDLCDKNPVEILDFQIPLDTTLNFPEFWTETEWKDLVDLIKRLIPKPETKLYGLQLCQRLEIIPERLQRVLIHLIKSTYESETNAQTKEECLNAINALKSRQLTRENEKEIDNFLQNIASEEKK